MDIIQRQILLNQKTIMLALIRNLQSELYTGVDSDIHKNNKQNGMHELIKAHNKTRDLLWEDSQKCFEEIVSKDVGRTEEN